MQLAIWYTQPYQVRTQRVHGPGLRRAHLPARGQLDPCRTVEGSSRRIEDIGAFDSEFEGGSVWHVLIRVRMVLARRCVGACSLCNERHNLAKLDFGKHAAVTQFDPQQGHCVEGGARPYSASSTAHGLYTVIRLASFCDR